MFVMTEAAAGQLTRMLEEAGAPEGTAIRIQSEGQGLKPRLDKPRPDDQVFDHEGKRVLLLDPGVSRMLEACLLDVEQTAQGPKLVIVS